MKNILMLLMVAGIFSLVACGPSEEEKAAAEAEAAAAVEELFNGLEEEATEEAAPVKVAHVCTDKCTTEAHAYACGEEGHVCSEACHAEKADGEAHEHTEGDGHEH